MTVRVRPERAEDAEAVRRVLESAFPTPLEAGLVEALRGHAEPSVALVAEQRGSLIGHILFTPVRVVPEDASQPWTAMALGPMAVVPEHQRRGVGSALVRTGLDACRALGEEVVFVLGHPAYYPRFGFRPAPPLGLTCKWPVPPEVFLVTELAPGALAGRTGRVTYHAAFDAI